MMAYVLVLHQRRVLVSLPSSSALQYTKNSVKNFLVFVV